MVMNTTQIMDTIGSTPIVRLMQLEAEYSLDAQLYAKIESMNPAGSVKDRVGKAMILQAEKDGKLKPGGCIVEPTSGNTGIALASVGAQRGYPVILTMPETMSAERRALLAAYGAKLVLTEGSKGMKGAIEKAKEIAQQTPGAFLASQFDNPANPAVHKATTGPEIWQEMEQNVDVFVAGVGTGGTITGVGQFLREVNPGIQIVALEPSDSPVLSGGKPGPHKIQGIGAGFVPSVLDTSIYDEVLTVSNQHAFEYGRLLATMEGILAGISSGAAVYGAIQIASRPENAGKRIVTILPDSGDRYLSTPLFTQE